MHDSKAHDHKGQCRRNHGKRCDRREPFGLQGISSVYQWSWFAEYQIERPKFMQMISWLLEGKYEGVIVLCWDRISRSEQSDMIVKELIDKHNISF